MTPGALTRPGVQSWRLILPGGILVQWGVGWNPAPRPWILPVARFVFRINRLNPEVTR